MSVKKKILIVFLVILAIPVAVAVFNIAGNSVQTFQAKNKVIKARDQAEVVNDSKLSDITSQLQSLGIINTKIASSKADICFIDHNDGGWMIMNWYQECYLRYVEGYTTDLTKTEVIQRSVAMGTQFGEVLTSERSQSIFPCRIIQSDSREIVKYIPANASDYGCETPNPNELMSVTAKPFIKTYQSFEPASIDRSQNQVWITFEDSYYHEDLGCGIGVICAQPRSKPVQAR